MSTVHRLRAGYAGPALAEAITAYLATLDHPETTGTHRVYAGSLQALRAALGGDRPVADLDTPAVAQQVTAWVTHRWGDKAPATFNRNLDALRSAIRYWIEQSWLVGDPTQALRRRGRAPDRTKALAKADIQALLTLEDIGIRERTLWRLLYETAARANEVLALDGVPVRNALRSAM